MNPTEKNQPQDEEVLKNQEKTEEAALDEETTISSVCAIMQVWPCGVEIMKSMKECAIGDGTRNIPTLPSWKV